MVSEPLIVTVPAFDTVVLRLNKVPSAIAPFSVHETEVEVAAYAHVPVECEPSERVALTRVVKLSTAGFAAELNVSDPDNDPLPVIVAELNVKVAVYVVTPALHPVEVPFVHAVVMLPALIVTVYVAGAVAHCVKASAPLIVPVAFPAESKLWVNATVPSIAQPSYFSPVYVYVVVFPAVEPETLPAFRDNAFSMLFVPILPSPEAVNGFIAEPNDVPAYLKAVFIICVVVATDMFLSEALAFLPPHPLIVSAHKMHNPVIKVAAASDFLILSPVQYIRFDVHQALAPYQTPFLSHYHIFLDS